MVKLQYSGHLIQRADSWEKILILGKIEGGRRRGWHRIIWVWANAWEILKDQEAWRAAVHGVAKSWMRLSDWMSVMSMEEDNFSLPHEKNQGKDTKVARSWTVLESRFCFSHSEASPFSHGASMEPLHCGHRTMGQAVLRITQKARAGVSVFWPTSPHLSLLRLLHIPPSPPWLHVLFGNLPSFKGGSPLFTHNSRNWSGNWQLLQGESQSIFYLFSIMPVWYEQIERLHLYVHLLPSGELILALGLLILQEGQWPLPKASCLHNCPWMRFQHVSRPGSLARFHVLGSSSCWPGKRST